MMNLRCCVVNLTHVTFDIFQHVSLAAAFASTGRRESRFVAGRWSRWGPELPVRIFEETLCKSDRPRGCTSPCAGRATFGPGRRGSDWRQTGHVGCFNMNLDQILNGDRSLKVKYIFSYRDTFLAGPFCHHSGHCEKSREVVNARPVVPCAG